jgi:hypothetical protein
MWIIAKYKSGEFNVFQDCLRTSLSGVVFYRPCYIKNNKLISILGTYCFVKHEAFTQNKILQNLKFTKGLNYFLSGCHFYQKQIVNFINYLKLNEQQDQIINSSLFYKYLNSKGVFLSGPLKDLIFNVLEDNKKSLTVSIEGYLAPIIVDKRKVAINFL